MGENSDAAPAPAVGEISWIDLTVPNAPEVRDFYCNVIGWDWARHNVGDYDDFDIKLPGDGKVVTGICHTKGINANVPPQWMIYVTVADVSASAQKCIDTGGKIVDGPRQMGAYHFCVIEDPAGAVMGLLSPFPDRSNAGGDG